MQFRILEVNGMFYPQTFKYEYETFGFLNLQSRIKQEKEWSYFEEYIGGGLGLKIRFYCMNDCRIFLDNLVKPSIVHKY